MLFSFTDWAQICRLLPDLQHTLAQLGLQLNVSKTSIMSHQSVLEEGRARAFAADSLIPQLTWGTKCVYLRKPLSHFPVGGHALHDHYADTSEILLEALGKACHASFQGLRLCIRHGFWSCIPLTMKLCNRYIGGTWFWYSPLIELLRKYSSKIRSLQTTFLVMMLGLYIPEDLNRKPAIYLHRLRRRTCLALLDLLPHLSWECIWLRRRWNYLGHLLRMPEDCIARRDVLQLSDTRQVHPGPWHHLHRWGQHVSGLPEAAPKDLAMNRDTWASKLDVIVGRHSQRHTIFHTCCAESWRDVLNSSVSWRLGIVLQVSCPGSSEHVVTDISWLDRVHGMQTFSRGGEPHEVIRSCQLEFAGVMLDVHAESWILDAYASSLMSLHASAFKMFQYVIMFNEISSSWAAKLHALSV